MFKIIKSFLANDSTFYAILIVLVAASSYGLGKHSNMQSATQNSQASISMSYQQPERVDLPQTTQKNSIVASKNGSKYHFLWCPGASQMNEENKIFFDTTKAARAAGYTPASNCKGLE